MNELGGGIKSVTFSMRKLIARYRIERNRSINIERPLGLEIILRCTSFCDSSP